MELIPRITGLFIEGLKPISDATREMIAKKFKGAVGLNIGMSPALVIGHPASGRALRPENWCGVCGKYKNSTDKPAENRPKIGLINNNTLMYLLESTAHPIPSEKEQGKVGITGSAKSRDNRPSVRGCDRQITGTLNILLFEIMLQFIILFSSGNKRTPAVLLR